MRHWKLSTPRGLCQLLKICFKYGCLHQSNKEQTFDGSSRFPTWPDQLKWKPPDTCLLETGRLRSKRGQRLLVTAHMKTHGRRKLCSGCPPVRQVHLSFCYSTKANHLRFPMQTWDRRLSRNPPDLQWQTGNAETSHTMDWATTGSSASPESERHCWATWTVCIV